MRRNLCASGAPTAKSFSEFDKFYYGNTTNGLLLVSVPLGVVTVT